MLAFTKEKCRLSQETGLQLWPLEIRTLQDKITVGVAGLSDCKICDESRMKILEIYI